jgi:hypothetical protein
MYSSNKVGLLPKKWLAYSWHLVVLLPMAGFLSMGVEMLMGAFIMHVDVLMCSFLSEVVYNLDSKADQHDSHERFEKQDQAVWYGQAQGNNNNAYKQEGGRVSKAPGKTYPKGSQRIAILTDNRRYRY